MYTCASYTSIANPENSTWASLPIVKNPKNGPSEVKIGHHCRINSLQTFSAFISILNGEAERELGMINLQFHKPN